MAENVVVAEELDKMQEMYDSTEGKKFEQVADGNYIATITEMKLVKSSSGKIQARTKFVILNEGDFFERPVFSYYTIDNQEGFAYFKGFAEAIAMPLPVKFSDLQAAMNDFCAEFKGQMKITVKTNKDGFKNVYFNGLHEEQ